MGGLLQMLNTLIYGGKPRQPVRVARSRRAPRRQAHGPHKWRAFLRQADNSRYVVMLARGGDIMEGSNPEWLDDAVAIRDRFNRTDWTLLNDVRLDDLADAMFYNGNRDRFPDAPRPPKGWRLW